MLMALSSRLARGAFLVQRRIGFRFFLVEVAAAFERPSSMITTCRPALASSSAVMPAPAPLPMMATSQRDAFGTGANAPPMTFQPRAMPSRIGSFSWLMRLSVSSDFHGTGISQQRPAGRVREVRAGGDIVQGGIGLLAQGQPRQAHVLKRCWMSAMDASSHGWLRPAKVRRPAALASKASSCESSACA
jgi:hypothetical protein